jgi:hypothetical protein
MDALKRLRGLLVGVIVLWGPLLLVSTLLVPTGGGLPLPHLAIATGLAFTGERILFRLFALPTAPPREGIFRVVPRYPYKAALLAALGVAVGFAGVWEVGSAGFGVKAIAALPASALLLVGAGRIRSQPHWGTWLVVVEDCLAIHAPSGDWRVPIRQIRRVFVRAGDQSYYIATPWKDRDTIVLTEAALGAWWIEDAEGLRALLTDSAPEENVSSLLGAKRRAEKLSS